MTNTDPEPSHRPQPFGGHMTARTKSMLRSRRWWEAAVNRAVKTWGQTAAALVGVAQVMEQVDWRVVGSSATLAAALSVLTSLGGLPEVEVDR